jgi:spermidine/putrescine transport system ATP-binding protein
MSVTILELETISKKYGQAQAVSDVDLTIQKGEFIALMGPSGCGKTTTLRMIAGLEAPTGGNIKLWGRSVNDDAPWERDTPLVWQSYALFPFLSVQRNVEFGLKQRGVPAKERAAKATEWLERMNLGAFAERLPAQLSGGQRQRVALARALATEPEILLLDEPLSALDPYLKISMQAELVRLHRELGITFICVTHSHSEAFAMADRVVLMNGGKIVQVGTPRDIHRRADTKFVAEFLAASNIVPMTVTSISAERVEGKSVFGSHVVSHQGAESGEMSVGSDISLIVPMDRVELTVTAQGAPDAVPAIVSTLEVNGATITVILKTVEGVLRAQMSSKEFEGLNLQIGDDVFANWDAANAYLVTK